MLKTYSQSDHDSLIKSMQNWRTAYFGLTKNTKHQIKFETGKNMIGPHSPDVFLWVNPNNVENASAETL